MFFRVPCPKELAFLTFLWLSYTTWITKMIHFNKFLFFEKLILRIKCIIKRLKSSMNIHFRPHFKIPVQPLLPLHTHTKYISLVSLNQRWAGDGTFLLLAYIENRTQTLKLDDAMMMSCFKAKIRLMYLYISKLGK